MIFITHDLRLASASASGVLVLGKTARS